MSKSTSKKRGNRWEGRQSRIKGLFQNKLTRCSANLWIFFATLISLDRFSGSHQICEYGLDAEHMFDGKIVQKFRNLLHFDQYNIVINISILIIDS